MWEAVELHSDHSEWRQLGSADSASHLRQQTFSLSSDGEVFYFWDGPFPSDPEESQRLFEEIMAANPDKEIRLTVGATIKNTTPLAGGTACSGRCFCVIAHGMRRCEVCYGNGAGSYCLPCGSNC